MATAPVEVIGKDEALKKLKEATGKTEAELKLVVKKAAFTVEAVAKEKCPVISGTLRRSIHAQTVGQTHSFFNSYTKKMEDGTLFTKVEDDWTYLVGTRMTYASAVESRKHYMEQGAKAAEKEFPELVQATVERVAKEVAS